MQLSSSPLNSAFSPDHLYVLQLVRHKMEAWNKLNHRYDTIRSQIIKLHNFPWINVFSCFPLWFVLLRAQCFHSISNPFWFCKDSADRCDWSLPLTHALMCSPCTDNFFSAPRNLYLVGQVLPKLKLNFEPWHWN